MACAQPNASATAALTPPPPTGRSAGDLALWRTAYINEAGVMPIGATDTAIEYAIGGSFSVTAEGTVRGWMRWEEFAPVSSPQGASRSARQLVEIDCKGGRGRLLAQDVYPYNNLQGGAQHLDAQDPQWTYARPGTVLEQNVGLLCAAARSAVTEAVMQASAEPSGSTLQGATPQIASAGIR